jgi:AraC-like DNA-binding protein
MHFPTNRPSSNALNIARICVVIERNLAVRHRITDLAKASGMAPHHFQRQFAAATGETVAGYLRSRRLEYAAIALSQSNARIVDIALDCGFETHAALTRAFTAHFGVSPNTFRHSGLPESFTPVQPRPFLKPIETRSLQLTCDILELSEQWLCWRRATGMIDGHFFPDIQKTKKGFRELGIELDDCDVTIGAGYPEGPRAFNDTNATAYFGALLDRKRALSWPEGWTQIDAGTFAVFPHHGSLTTVHLTWHRAARIGLGRLGLKLRPSWMFETYLTSQIHPPSNQLSALIHLPVQKGTIGKA